MPACKSNPENNFQLRLGSFAVPRYLLQTWASPITTHPGQYRHVVGQKLCKVEDVAKMGR